MNIMKLIQEKRDNNAANEGVTIAFLGDSVTQGCFEIYKDQAGNIETVFDKNCTYHRYLDRILTILYPNVPINIINAGISGGNAHHGLGRLERDVIRHQPDLTVVCFGLNDSGAGMEGIGQYAEALEHIFENLKAAGSEIIFMTPNMMNTYVSSSVTDEDMRSVAESKQEIQNQGILEAYLNTIFLGQSNYGIKTAAMDYFGKELDEHRRQLLALPQPLLRRCISMLLAEQVHLLRIRKHAPFISHAPCNQRGFFNVVGCAGAHSFAA